MDIVDIVKALERNAGSFPREALEAAVEQREAITPELLDMLEYTVANAEELAGEPREDVYFGHLYAMFLLAQFRETRAFPLIVRFCELPGRTPEDLLEDSVTEDLHRILASTFDGDTEALKRIIENPACNEYVRSAVLNALVVLVRMGVKQRDEVMAYMEELFRGKLERAFSFAWCGLADCAVMLYPGEVYEDIRQAYEEGLVEPFFMNFYEVEEVFAKGKERVLEVLPTNVPGPIDDTIEDMEHWACFRETPRQSYPSPSPVPEARPAPKPHKVGRNDPCPCGSGKKYKKCCG
ncbi:MAG: DUF1186 domain-containing protein [Candidatus Hydrogenedentota bacterium]